MKALLLSQASQRLVTSPAEGRTGPSRLLEAIYPVEAIPRAADRLCTLPVSRPCSYQVVPCIVPFAGLISVALNDAQGSRDCRCDTVLFNE